MAWAPASKPQFGFRYENTRHNADWPCCAPCRACHTDGVGLYEDQILPRAINLALRGGEFAGPRARAAAGWTVCGFQNSATGLDLGFYAARSYSLTRPPRTGRRFIRS